MKVLVTGGAGFIGSNLCRNLLSDGYFVYCMDNLSTGFKNNILDIVNNSRFCFVHHDINHKLPNLLVDQIYNLASPASPPLYQKDPIFTIKTNIIGLFNVLDLAIQCRAKVLHASTSEVYGDPEVEVQNESYTGNVNTISIRSCYDESKRLSETIMCEYHNVYKLDTKIVRFFNVYGPGLDPSDGRVVSNFIFQALNGYDITIYGDGSQTRSFQYISDAINGIKLLMNNDFHKPINIGNPAEFTIKELANKVIAITNSKSNIVYKDLPKDDPKQRKPDIALANSVLKWWPKVNLDDGLKMTIKHFKENYVK